MRQNASYLSKLTNGSRFPKVGWFWITRVLPSKGTLDYEGKGKPISGIWDQHWSDFHLHNSMNDDIICVNEWNFVNKHGKWKIFQ